MDIIEKVKEVPSDYYCDKYSRHSNYASKGLAGAALGIGIGGLALSLLNRGNGFNLFGSSLNTPENVNILNSTSTTGNAPTAFQAWEKESQDVFNLQKELYDYAILDQNQRFNDRSVLNQEIFGVYKNTRDNFDITNSRITKELFSLYKETRDQDDAIRKELSDLKAQVAINAAVRPYQDELLQSEIRRVHTDSRCYTDAKTCKAIYGQLCLPSTPVITGYVGANTCGCPTVITQTTGA